MNKILLIGSEGMLGSELLTKLADNKENVIETTTIYTLDITDRCSVLKKIEEFVPDYIINCAAYTNVDSCETNKETAMNVNGKAIFNLAIAANKVNATLIQISTDYVFKGDLEVSKAYTEDMKVEPVTMYGKSKLLGEQNAMIAKKHYILRTAWLYGQGKNFVRTMLNLAKTKKELNVVADQNGSPTSCTTLCNIIVQIMQIKPPYGIYHSTNEGFTTWYDFAKLIFEISNVDIKVNPVTSNEYVTPAKRPLNSKLSKKKLRSVGIIPEDYKIALINYLKKEE